MLDDQSTEQDVALELGFRVVRLPVEGEGNRYQYQKLDAAGKTVTVMPTHAHAYLLWKEVVGKTIALAKALDEEAPKSNAPQVA